MILSVLSKKEYTRGMTKKEFSSEEATRIGAAIGIDFSQCTLEEFRMGLSVELEHGARDSETNVTNDDELLTAKIKEIPDYYTRLKKMETEAGA
jgi:Protein of unknown function (DUF5661)